MKHLILPFAVMTLFLFQPLTEAGLTEADEKQIEALIASVGRMVDTGFIRNGRAYNSAIAAKFLRLKWQQQSDKVRSAEDFIEKVASFSSTTGRLYMIRFSDGREIPCSVVLRDELSKLRNDRQ